MTISQVTVFHVARYFALSLVLFVGASVPALVAAAETTVPLYKPSSRSPEPLDITKNAYGFSNTAPAALKIGDVAPNFVVPGQGQMLELAKLSARGPVVIVFYRGHW